MPVNKINVEGMASGMTILTSGDYCLYGQFDQNYHFGADGVDQLANTANWSNFANGTSGGKQINGTTATGGPTLDMWIASWNAKGYTPIYSKKETKQKNDANEANQADYDSYYIGTDEIIQTFNVNVATRDESSNPNNGYGDILYFPHTEKKYQLYGYSQGYWLTSPSAINYQCVAYVCIDGFVGPINFNYTAVAIRPVICLPSTIFGEQDGTGKWVLK